MIGQLLTQANKTPTESDQICPSQPNLLELTAWWIQNQRQWCTFEVVDKGTYIVELIYAVLLFILLAFFICRCCRLRWYMINEEDSFGDFYLLIHFIVGLWFLCTIGRVVVSITSYEIQILNPYHKTNPDINSPIVRLAATYTVLNFLCGFLANLLVLLIPYKWISVCLLSIREEDLSLEFRKSIDRWFIVLTIIKIYIYFRFIFLLILLIEPFIFYFPFAHFQYYRCEIPLFKQKYSKDSYLFMIGQSSVIILFDLFAGYALVRVKRLNIIKLSKRVYTKISYEYLLLLISVIGRICVNIFRVLLNQDSFYRPNQRCYDENQQNDIALIITLSINHILMHLAPITVSLYIYRLTIVNRNDSEFFLNNNHLSSVCSRNNLPETLLKESSGGQSSQIFGNGEQSRQQKDKIKK